MKYTKHILAAVTAFCMIVMCLPAETLTCLPETLPPVTAYAAENEETTDPSETTVSTEATEIVGTADPSETTEAPAPLGTIDTSGTSGTCGENVTWHFNAQTGALAIDGEGDMSAYSSKNYTEIPWYSLREQIKIATVGKDVTSISPFLFYKYPTLEHILIYGKVKEIGEYAFMDCSSLTSVSLPNCVEHIGIHAFTQCRSITSLKLPSNLKTIDSQAFCNCSGLTELVLPDSLTTIGDKAFLGCDNLETITIPAGVTYIGTNPFQLCYGLTNIIVDSGNSVYQSRDGVLFKTKGAELIAFPYNKWRDDYPIPDGVKRIGINSFRSNFQINRVIMPDSVTSIGEYAFSGCYNLNSVEFSSNITSIEPHAFEGSGVKSITLPAGMTVLEDHVFSGSKLVTLELPDGMTTIGEQAVSGCKELVSVTIPASVTTIADDAFAECEQLTIYCDANSAASQYAAEHSIPTKLVDSYSNPTISGRCGDHTAWEVDLTTQTLTISGTGEIDLNLGTFDDAPWYLYHDDIKTLVIADGVTGISDEAFRSLNALTSVTIPKSVTYIGTDAFAGTPWLHQKHEKEPLVVINGILIFGWIKDEKVVIPDTVTCIGPGAFMDSFYLTEVTIPDSVTTIGACAFYNCDHLTSLTIPDGVTSIGSQAFAESDQLTSVTIPDSVTSIGTEAFYHCAELTDVRLSGRIRRLPSYLFCACTSLSSITIPEGVEYIEDKAFICCESLSDVTLPASLNRIDERVFDCCPALQSVTFLNPACSIAGRNDTFTNAPVDLDDLWLLDIPYSEPETAPSFSGTLYGYADSTAQTYAAKYGRNFSVLESPAEPPSAPSTEPGFIWGEDNWNLENAAPGKSFQDGITYRDLIDPHYRRMLSQNLTNTEYQVVFQGDIHDTLYHQAWLDKRWGSSGYGMAATALLSLHGLLPYADYQPEAATLHELPSASTSSAVCSLINYYQMLQASDVFQNQLAISEHRNHYDNIKTLIATIDRYGAAMIGLENEYIFRQTVLAYDYHYGNWEWNGWRYDCRISLYDPKLGDAPNPEHDLYISTRNGFMTIPIYEAEQSIAFIIGDPAVVNSGGCLPSGTAAVSSSDIAFLDLYEIAEAHSVSKLKKQENGAWGKTEADQNNIICNRLCRTADDYIEIYHSRYHLYDTDSAYAVTQEQPQAMNLTMRYPNCTLNARSNAGSEIDFAKEGKISIKSDPADYSMCMTYNDRYPTDWFSISVYGKDAANVTMRMVSGGYILEADNLSGIHIYANNRDVSAALMFSTDADKVFIYEINKCTIGVSVDSDGNGSYETLIAQSETPTLGDVNADGDVTAADAAEILIAAAVFGAGEDSVLTGTQMFVADIDKDNAITAADAAPVLMYAAAIGAGDPDAPLEQFA